MNIKDYLLIASTVVCVGLIVFGNKEVVIHETSVERDTVTTVDTVTVTKTKVIERLSATIDTVYITDNDSIGTIITAKADTLLLSDSSRIDVTYYFPPQNFFDITLDIKERVIERLKLITEVQTVDKEFYADHWFWSTVIMAAILVLTIK